MTVLHHALVILRSRVRTDTTCNTSFQRLPLRRSFQTLFDDSRNWINYDPVNGGELWGWVEPVVHPNDIVLTQYALRTGVWATAATIVHELAHLNGAPGGTSHAAELRVKECHMQSPNGPYDPSVQG
jgi:hypothetical protein